MPSAIPITFIWIFIYSRSCLSNLICRSRHLNPVDTRDVFFCSGQAEGLCGHEAFHPFASNRLPNLKCLYLRNEVAVRGRVCGLLRLQGRCRVGAEHRQSRCVNSMKCWRRFTGRSTGGLRGTRFETIVGPICAEHIMERSGEVDWPISKPRGLCAWRACAVLRSKNSKRLIRPSGYMLRKAAAPEGVRQVSG